MTKRPGIQFPAYYKSAMWHFNTVNCLLGKILNADVFWLRFVKMLAWTEKLEIIDFFRSKKTTRNVTRGCFKGYQKKYKGIRLTKPLTRALKRPEVAKGFIARGVTFDWCRFFSTYFGFCSATL